MTTPKIPTRPLGTTGEDVTFVGLGGAHLRTQSDEEGIATVHWALELGVTYFETSPAYSSQAVLGEALEGRPETYIAATKLGYFKDPADYRLPSALRAQLEENLRLLRRDRIDVLQVHEADWRYWWTDDGGANRSIRPDESLDFADAPVMRFLRDVRAEGLCRYIGITGNNADAMVRILRDVEVDVYLVAFNYDLIWRRARREAVPLAKEKGAAMVLGAPFHNGRLTAPNVGWLAAPPGWMDAGTRARFQGLYEIRRESGLSLPTLVIRFLMGDPDVATVLLGCGLPSEVGESARAAQAGPLPPDLHRAIDALGIP